jgi:aspartate racemase
MSAIGILGGMGPQASARLVELLIEKTPNFVTNPLDSDYPEIILLSVPVPNFISNKKNMLKTKKILIERTKLLEQSGSTINCIACNTTHLLLPELQANSQVPFLSIPILVAERIKSNKFRRVGLLATPSTLASSLYDDALEKSVVLIRPNDVLKSKLEKLILKQLRGNITNLDRNNFKDIVANFLEVNKLDAVILGCTELPVIFGENTDKRIIDTLEVLSNALLEKYFN